MKNISTFGRAMAQVMRSRMAFHDMTQQEMAEAIQISQSQLSKILRGDRTIDLESFEAFCEALDEDASTLIKEGEQLADNIRRSSPDVYVPAAHIRYVENGIKLDIPRPVADEVSDMSDEERIAVAKREYAEKPWELAALHDPNKKIEMMGDAGPDWDEPA